nr:MAG TPA: hypothetical protein [Caudoviricetes sp.]
MLQSQTSLLKMMTNMIESEYVKSIVRKIVEDKRSKNIVPDRALLGEIDKVVCEDTLNCLRQLYKDKEITANRSLNSISFGMA